MKQLLALDFGGTFVKHSLVNLEGNIAKRSETPAPLDSIESFIKVVQNLYEKYKDEVAGIALSMPGIIDSDTGSLYTAGAYTPVLGGKNVFDVLKKTGARISVENDGKSAILAEAWKGTLQGIQNAVAIIIGSGLAGGIIIDGKLCRGAYFSAGEFGCLPTEIGNYKSITSLAHQAGTSALLRNVADAKGMNPAQFEIAGVMSRVDADPKLPIYSGRDVFRWIDEGDTVVCQVYQKWLAALVHVIYSLKLILDPEKIVIGGGVSRNPRLINDIRAEYKKTKNMTAALAFLGLELELELDVCSYTADANMIGAAYNWMLHFEKDKCGK